MSENILKNMETVRGIITEIRQYRQIHHIPKHEKVDIELNLGTDNIYPEYASILYKMGNVGNIKTINNE